MKKLLIIVPLLLWLGVSAQDTSKLTAKYIYEDVKVGISNLAAKLQGPAAHVYKVYVKQHQVEGVIEGTILLLALLGFGGLFFWGVFTQDIRVDFEEPTRLGVIIILSGIFFLTALIVLSCCGTDTYTKLTNPEYWAIQDIIKAFK